MTEEEYYDLYEHYLEKEYGAGWEFVKEYVDLMNYAQSLQDCWHCWGWLYPRLFAEKFYNTYYTYAKFDYALFLLEQAIDLAETPQELKQCELLLITALYKGCYSSYFIEYENENNERLAVLSERYDRAMDLMRKYGFTMGTYTTIDGMKCDFQYTSIEDAAWIDWYLDWDALYPNHTRPEPEKYVGLERK